MNEAYEKELSDLKYKMEKAEEFAKRLPFFSDVILRDKLSGGETHKRYAEKYKKLYFGWGINRGLYETGTNRTITNYNGEPYKEYLFSIYINTLSIYDSHEKFGLSDIAKTTPVFFYDCLNSTFYATDDQIEGLLEALSAWYGKAIELLSAHKKQKEITDLEEKLAKLKG